MVAFDFAAEALNYVADSTSPNPLIERHITIPLYFYATA